MRVALTAIEWATKFTAAGQKLTFGTFGALYASRFGGGGRFAITAKFACPFTGRVLHTGQEVTKAPFAYGHRAATNITGHIRHGNQITGTITAFDSNVTVAVTVEVAGEIAFGVMVTAHKFTLATKAHHQHATLTFGAGQTRRNINPYARIGDNRVVKWLIKCPDNGHPRGIAVGNGIEVFFHIRRKFIVDDIGKITDQQISHRHSQYGRCKALIGCFDIFAIDNRCDGGGIGRWSANPEAFELFDEAGITKAWQWFSEVLVGG